METWLKKNKDRLSIRAIEKEIGCPASTLTKVVNGRKLPQKWSKPLMDIALDMSMIRFGMPESVLGKVISEDEPIFVSDEIIKEGREKGLSSEEIMKMVEVQKKKKKKL